METVVQLTLEMTISCGRVNAEGRKKRRVRIYGMKQVQVKQKKGGSGWLAHAFSSDISRFQHTKKKQFEKKKVNYMAIRAANAHSRKNQRLPLPTLGALAVRIIFKWQISVRKYGSD